LTAQGWLLHRAPFYNFCIETLPLLTLVTMVMKTRGFEFAVPSINAAILASHYKEPVEQPVKPFKVRKTTHLPSKHAHSPSIHYSDSYEINSA
jgi:hypothetical protein